MNTLIRGIEAFIAVAISAFFSQIAIEGKPLDVTSKDGQSRLIAAVLAAVLIAIRQFAATQGGNASTTPTTPTS